MQHGYQERVQSRGGARVDHRTDTHTQVWLDERSFGIGGTPCPWLKSFFRSQGPQNNNGINLESSSSPNAGNARVVSCWVSSDWANPCSEYDHLFPKRDCFAMEALLRGKGPENVLPDRNPNPNPASRHVTQPKSPIAKVSNASRRLSASPLLNGESRVCSLRIHRCRCARWCSNCG